MTRLHAFLDGHDVAAWRDALAALRPSIHEVDRRATDIWFHFFPLELARALARADDPAALARTLRLQGAYRLADQVDTSHRFLYGHRYWPEVKQAILASGDEVAAGVTLADLVRAVAGKAARAVAGGRTDVSLVLGITAVGLMTLQQAGPEAFGAAPGQVHLDPAVAARRASAVLERRTRRRRAGWWSRLTGQPRWPIVFDENTPSSTFDLVSSQTLATAAGGDKRPHHERDRRCTPNEGPIPVECRSASCGTCWVGVLAGGEHLADVVDRDEGRRIKEFGYIDTAEPKPIIRLACQAQAFGPVSIVIPPWNGVFGRQLRAWRARD